MVPSKTADAPRSALAIFICTSLCSLFLKILNNLGLDQYGIFEADADINIREEENDNIRYVSAHILYVKYFECGYQIHVTKTCNGGRISNKLYSKHQCTEQ